MDAAKLGTITVVHTRKYNGPGKVYIGRGSIFGNKFPVSLGRAVCIEKWLVWAREEYANNHNFKTAVIALCTRVLDGEDLFLACYCAPQACHGDKLKFIIERVCSYMQAELAKQLAELKEETK